MKTIKIFQLVLRSEALLRRVELTFTFSLLFCVSCNSTGSEFGVQSSSSQNSVLRTQNSEQKSEVDTILEKLNQRTESLKTYQCQIEYRYEQPSLFGTTTLRKGVLYYSKQDSMSNLRVNFQTLKQDEDEEQEYKEQYILVDGAELVSRDSSLVSRGTSDLSRASRSNDERRFEGLWLIQLDYDSKNCNYIQLARIDEPNKPVDVFELVSKYFPIVGFTKAERLKEEFYISLVTGSVESVSPSNRGQDARDTSSDELIQVKFKVKPNSVHKDNYIQIDCWIDEKLNLPVEIKAISTEPEGETLENKDVFEIKFDKAQINEKIDKKVFDFQIPKDFGEPDIYPLESSD